LRWRQGGGAWQEMVDDIYPYEFSPELHDDAGDFEGAMEIENARQEIQSSPVIALGVRSDATEAAPAVDADNRVRESVASAAARAGLPALHYDRAIPLDPDFLAYLQRAANGNDFGLRGDGRYYPYSTPQGRRIGWRQAVWDKALHAHGCTREEAEQHLRAELARTSHELRMALAARQPAVEFTRLDRRQQETLLDVAHSEGIAGLRPEFVAAVLAKDWPRMIDGHLYVRYAGHAPDHPRNKAFAQRWSIP
jgi:hypothetical protein